MCVCEILHKFGELGGSFARGRPSLALGHWISPSNEPNGFFTYHMS